MRKICVLLACTASVLPLSTVASAQEVGAGRTESSDASEGELGDIVVVARRREEALQTVPVAVTAVAGTTLQDRDITGALDLPRIAPGLTTTPSGGVSRNLPLYTIRGQQQGEFLASTDPSVGIYWGDILIQRAYGSDLNLFDMQQVEVLKGPQGTLFGRNTTGGNIVFRSHLPTDELGGGAQLRTGSFNLVDVQAFANVPIAEGIALRIAAGYRRDDGYISNVFATPFGSTFRRNDINDLTFTRTAGIARNDLQSSSGGGIRASLKIDSGAFSNVTVGTYLSSQSGGTGYRLLALRSASPAAGFTNNTRPGELAAINALPYDQVRNGGESFAKTHYSWSVANTATYELSDAIAIKNITGYHKYKASHFDDLDGSAANILEFGQTPSGWEFSNEFQVSGDYDKFNWIGGVYYFDEKAENASYSALSLSPANPGSGGERAENRSVSIFLSGTVNLTDAVSLTAGGRHTWDQRKVAFSQRDRIDLFAGQGRCALTNTTGYTAFNFSLDSARCVGAQNTDFSAFTYTVSLDWKLSPQHLLYVAHRKGYRSGGFNTRGTEPSGYGTFQPETVRDVELGFKGEFDLGSDIRFRSNIAAYYQWYSDIQRLITFTPPSVGGGGPARPQTVVQNAASANIYGGEAELNLRVGDWFESYANFALVKPDYNQFLFQGRDFAATASFGGVSEKQYSAGVKFKAPASFAKPSLSIDWYRQSSFVQASAITVAPEEIVPAFELTNLRMELAEIDDTNLTLGVSVNNLFDRKYLRSKFSLFSQLGFVSGFYGKPRTWTADLRFRF